MSSGKYSDPGIEAREEHERHHQACHGAEDNRGSVVEGPAQLAFVHCEHAGQYRSLEPLRQAGRDVVIQAPEQDHRPGDHAGREQVLGREAQQEQRTRDDERPTRRRRERRRGIVFETQEHGAQSRNDDQSHEQRARQRDDQGRRHELHELAHLAGPKQQWSEGGQGGQRCGDDRHRNFTRGLLGGYPAVPTLFDVSVDVLYDDDGVVHQHPQGQDQGEQDHHVKGGPGQLKDDERKKHRGRDRDGHEHRVSGPQEEERIGERGRWAYAFKTLEDAGVLLSLNGVPLTSDNRDHQEVAYIAGEVNYWIRLPQKLKDPGVFLWYDGQDSSGRHTVRVTFGEGVGDHQDTYFYYFVGGRVWPVQVDYREAGSDQVVHTRWEDIRGVDGYHYVGARVHFDDQGRIYKIIPADDVEVNPALGPEVFSVVDTPGGCTTGGT